MIPTPLRWTHTAIPATLIVIVAACGGGSGYGGGGGGGGITTYTVGGQVTGLTGSGLVLQNNSGDDLAVSAAGAFTFPTALANGAAFAVTVKTQPSSPNQLCTVTNGTGTVGAANVASVAIDCAATATGRYGYVANRGDNSISAYSVYSNGALVPLGTPVATGTSPYALAGSPDKKHLYVVNQVSNNISAYTVDTATGALTEMAGSPFPAGTDPQALSFDPSGAYLYVANTGSNDLSAYAVDASTGFLTPLSTATYATGSGPTAVSVDLSGKFVYVANNGGSNDISVFALTPATGALTAVAGSPFAAGANPHSLAVSTYSGTTTHVYTANSDGTSISGFSVNLSTGALTALPGSPFNIASSNYIGLYSGYGDTLFVTTAAGVVGYYVGADGLLTAPGASYSAVAGTNAYSVTVHLSSFLYVANDGAASISAYVVDDVDGTLTEVPGSPFPAGTNPDFIAIL